MSRFGTHEFLRLLAWRWSGEVTEDNGPRCSWAGCSHPANTSFEGRPLCIKHFLELAPRHLESIEAALNDQTGARQVLGNIQAALSQMISETSALAASRNRLQADERERLISFSETAVLHRTAWPDKTQSHIVGDRPSLQCAA